MTIQLNASARLIAGHEALVLAYFMKKHGYKLLGSGAEASAWTKDKKVVLKVMYADRAANCLAYVDYVRKNPSPYAPKFYETKTIALEDYKIKSSKSIVAVSVEYLAPVPANYKMSKADQQAYSKYEAEIYDYGRAHNFYVDLGTRGNILYRQGDHRLVISDPFSTK